MRFIITTVTLLNIIVNISCSENKPEFAAIEYTDSINVNDVFYKDSLFGSIEVSNIGSTHLIIKSVQPDCQCTIVSFDTLPVKPGEKNIISYFLKLSDTGRFEKSIVFEANTDSVFHAVLISGHAVEKGEDSERLLR